MTASAAFDLSGQSALVTGANTGIGQAIAVALAGAGADVVALVRSDASETVDLITALGRRCTVLSASIESVDSIRAAIDSAFEQVPNLSILVNNAGTIRRSFALDFTESDWDDVMGLNLKSAFFLAQAFARNWLAGEHAGASRPQAKLINVVSMLSFQGGLRTASYTASKTGLLGVTRLLANEWAARGINVNALAPGYIETNNTTALRADAQRNKDILARIPAGRWGQPGDLAGAAVFLASPASNYVHGAVLPVDGGWLAR